MSFEAPTCDGVKISPAAERKGGTELAGVERNGQLEGDGRDEGGCAAAPLEIWSGLGLVTQELGRGLLKAKRAWPSKKPAGSQFGLTDRLPAGLAVQQRFPFFSILA